ncbi:beta-keratin-related protein-like [Alligator mississippiensis]|nr:beta-keratin-related protein-like [Alligator mississippiensis]
MSSYGQLISSRCYNPCEVTCPRPYADAWNEPCVTSCGDSRAVVYPPPVAITFPGPILASCPQESYVGTSEPQCIGGPYTAGGYLGYRGSVGTGYSYPSYSRQLNRYRYGGCGPC